MMRIRHPDCSTATIPTLRRNRYPIGLFGLREIIILPKPATYSDCVVVLPRASQKRNSQSQPRNDSARLLLRELGLNLFVLSDLRARHTWWHAQCIKHWREHNQYYEQQIRIHLRPSSPVGRKRSRRSRDCSLCGLYSERRLLNLAVRADARDSPSAGN